MGLTNDYFKLLMSERWTKKRWNGPLQYEDRSGKLMMLPTDMEIVKDKEFRKVAEEYAADEDLFKKDFVAAWEKLIDLVLSPSSSIFVPDQNSPFAFDRNSLLTGTGEGRKPIFTETNIRRFFSLFDLGEET